MAMAMRDSVTVSMSEEMTGMFRCSPSASVVSSCGVARQNFRVERRERYVIVGQPKIAVGREEGVRRLVELGIELVGLFRCCHVL